MAALARQAHQRRMLRALLVAHARQRLAIAKELVKVGAQRLQRLDRRRAARRTSSNAYTSTRWSDM